MVAKLIALVLPLGLDTFAVSAALGAIEGSGADGALRAPAPAPAPAPARGRRLRIALLFTAFEAGMPLIGLALGAPLGRTIGKSADYVAIGVLVASGLYTMLGRDEDDDRMRELVEVRGAGAVLLGISISLDELAIGFTLGLLRLPVALVIVLIAVQAFVVTQLGLRLGARLSEALREGAERLAGIVLTILGLVLLAEKLLG